MKTYEIFDLSNKVILLTGSSGLLGRLYSIGLSEAGATVILADKDIALSKKLVKEIRKKYNNDSIAIKVNLESKRSISAMINTVNSKFSKIDVLINNAAYQGNSKIRKSGFENLSLDIWNNAMNINLTSIFLTCQLVGKQMIKQQYGNIINIGSTYGIVAPDQKIYGNSGQNSAAFYAATKSGLIHLTKYLATYWEGKGIRVNSLSPGGVFNNQDPEFIKNYAKKTPMNRMANKEEYVDSLIFLASDASSYMTGSNLVVDGGWTAW